MDDHTYEYEDWNNWVGQRVCAKGTMFGTLRYYGETSFSSGIWCGIELDDPLGKNDGTVFGVKYFTCKHDYGIFVPISKVTKLSENPVKIKENILSGTKQNETFGILGCHANSSSAEINNLNEEPFAYNNLVDGAIKKAKEDLSRLRMDSEESLGILCSDELENSFDSLIPDYSLSSTSLPCHQFDINCIQDFVFTQPYIAARTENIISDVISCPKYASTPRQTVKNKFEGHLNDLPANLSLDMGLETEDKVFTDETIKNNSQVFFDFDKFKDNPNLSSTSKTQLNFDSPIQENENKENISFENKISMVNQQNSLNLTQTFSKQIVNLTFGTDPLNKTFSLVNPASCMTDEKESEKSFNDIKNIKVEETKMFDKNLNCTFKKEELNNEFNLNATYELKFPISICENHPQEKEEINNLPDKVNTLNESESKNTVQNVSDKEVTLNNVSLVENFSSSDSSSVKDNLKNLFGDIKKPDLLESNCGKAKALGIVGNLLLEEKCTINSNTMNENFNDTVKQGINTSNGVVTKNSVKKESFSYKSKFLKELDSIQKSSSSRQSISLPFKNDRKSMNIPRNSDKGFNLNSTICLRKEKVNSEKSFSHTSRKSLSEDLKNKTNVCEKSNNEFKKPFAPCSFTRGSKLASKPQSFIDSKIRTNQPTKSYFKGNSGNSKSVCNTSHELKVNSFDEPYDDSSNKSNHKHLSNTKSKLPLSSRHSLVIPTKRSDSSSSNLSLTASEESNLLNTTCVLSLKKENESSSEFISKNSSDLKSRFNSKTSHSNARDMNLNNLSKKDYKETNLSDDLKGVTQISGQVNNNRIKQLKASNDLQNSVRSKLPKKINNLNISTEENHILRRSSLSSYSLEKLPGGIVKSRSSLLQPTKIVNKKLEPQGKCIPSLTHNIEKAEVKTRGQLGSGIVQSLRNIKDDASKGNSKLKEIKSSKYSS